MPISWIRYNCASSQSTWLSSSASNPANMSASPDSIARFNNVTNSCDSARSFANSSRTSRPNRNRTNSPTTGISTASTNHLACIPARIHRPLVPSPNRRNPAFASISPWIND